MPSYGSPTLAQLSPERRPQRAAVERAASQGCARTLFFGWQGTLVPARDLLAHGTTLPGELERLLAPRLAEARSALERRLPPAHLQCGGRRIPLDGVLASLRMRLAQICAPWFLERADAHGSGPDHGSGSALGRALDASAREWTRGTAKFLRRLQADARRLAVWRGTQELPPLVGLAATAADPHGSSQGWRLVFSDGPAAFYKPRAVTGEILWSDLLRQIAATAPNCALPHARVLAGGLRERSSGAQDASAEYGWMEALEFDGAQAHSPEAVARYWQAAGQLLSIATHTLLSDLNLTNIIATAQGPAVADAECLGAPLDGERRGASSFERIAWALGQTGLLPFPAATAGSEELSAPDLSGLFGQAATVPGLWLPDWEEDGCGRARCSLSLARLLPHSNRTADGATPIAALASMLAGYRQGAGALLAARSRLLAPGGWLARLDAEHAPRILVRNTFSYGLLASRLLQSRRWPGQHDREELRAGLRHTPRLASEAVARAALDAEIQAVAALRIPRFVALPGSRTLASSSRTPVRKNAFEATPADAVHRRLQALCFDALESEHLPALSSMLLSAAA